MARIGLFFGSFNPIHIGHLIIASHFVENTDLESVWFVVSPLNPFKEKKTLASERHRYNMVQVAIENNQKFRASDIEFKLPQPSYTIDTLTILKEKHPTKDFALIMGSDNLLTLQNWKNYAQIIANYPIYVFERPDYKFDTLIHSPDFKQLVFAKAPLLEISASFIRESIKRKKSIQYLVPDSVIQYIEESRLYN